ncbi:MAG TPA: ATP-binding protein [Pirellulales bacterium]|nr:ATP-binding protein [Pirellulales bacterium]
MNDRRRLLTLSVLVLSAVSLATMAVTAWQLLPAGSAAWHTPSFRFALGSTAVLIFAGATLLLRVAQPLLRRLEESEAQTRAIIETAVDGIITIDQRGTVLSCNPASERLFGCQAAELIGKSIDSVIKPSPLALLDADQQQAVGRRGDGSELPLELSVGGHLHLETPRYTAVMRDISDRKRDEAQRRAYLEQLVVAKAGVEAKAAELARANQELDDFTYVVSHDLKEPLRGISAYCGILLEEYEDKLDDNGRRMMSTLVVLCQRLDQLIDGLLTYSRLGRAPELVNVNLDEVLDRVLETLGPAIDGRGGAVRRLGALPTVRAEVATIGLVLQNLISNGLKFNDNTPPEVEIGCLEGDPLTIYVRDNGIGIEPRHHEAVFSMFRRLHGRQKYEGTGAGLTIVRKIIEAHGGRVWLESEPGCGSTFMFTLSPGRPAENLAAADSHAAAPVQSRFLAAAVAIPT